MKYKLRSNQTNTADLRNRYTAEAGAYTECDLTGFSAESHDRQSNGTTRAVYKLSNPHTTSSNTILEDKHECFCCRQGDFSVHFQKIPTDGRIFELTKNGCGIDLVSHDAAAQCCHAHKDSSCSAQNEITIKEVKENTDIQYVVENRRIKENIIVKARHENYVFDFDINLTNLEVSLSEDSRSIEFKNKADGKTEFVIPAPFMYDADKVYSNAVHYEVADNGDNKISIKVIADKEFINAEGRAFPVVIDPQIIINNTGNAFTAESYWDYYGDTGFESNYLTVVNRWDQLYIYSNLYISGSCFPANITRAVLKLNGSGAETGPILIDGTQYEYPADGKYEIDITHKAQAGMGTVIYFDPIAGYSLDMGFDISGGPDGVSLQVDYIVPLQTIEIATPPTKTIYIEGESFDPTGMTVKAKYTDGTSRTLSASEYSYSPMCALSLGSTPLTVSYTEGGITKTAEVSISAKMKDKIDTSKLNQSELKYSCGAGAASVNLYTGRMLLDRTDMSMGANSYAIGVSHVYNSHFDENTLGTLPDNVKTGMGNGWKLNVQQYVFAYRPPYNLDGFESGDYVYIDTAGFRHRFVQYDTIPNHPRQFATTKKYNDTTGLGLTLDVVSQIPYTNIISIHDQTGNTTNFVAGRLTSTESAVNAEIKKFYDYTDGQLTSIYDNRKTGRRLTFSYYTDGANTGLLSDIVCKEGGVEKSRQSYFYDNGGNLTKITKTAPTGETKDTAYYEYDGSFMTYAIDAQDKSALRFEYEEGKVSKVTTGVADIGHVYGETSHSVYCGSDVLCGTVVCGESAMEIVGYEHKKESFKQRSFNTFLCEEHRCIVTNEKEIKICYFFNTKGITKSIFEDESEISKEKYRTLNKVSGLALLNSGNISSTSINGNNVYSAGKTFTLNNGFANFTDVLTKLREADNYKTAENYVISFWLKTSSSLEDYVTLKFNIKGGSYLLSQHIMIDSAAVGSWQFLSVPVHLGRAYIDNNATKLESIVLEFSANSTVTREISDIRIIAAQVPRMMLNQGTASEYLGRITSYKINGGNDTFVGQENFFTENDIQKSYLNLYKAKTATPSSSAFDLVLCDGTKRISGVTDLKMYAGGNPTAFVFGMHNSSNYSPKYFYESKSPDNVISSSSSVTYIKNELLHLNYSIADCIQFCYSVSKQPSGNTIVYKWTDLAGKTLKTKDAYEVEEVYYYDDYGNLTKKIKYYSGSESRTGDENLPIVMNFKYAESGECLTKAWTPRACVASGEPPADGCSEKIYSAPAMMLERETDFLGKGTGYFYDAFDMLTEIRSEEYDDRNFLKHDATSQSLKLGYGLDAHNNPKYTYDIVSNEDVSEVKISGATVLEFNRKTSADFLYEDIKYGNSDIVYRSKTDKYGRLINMSEAIGGQDIEVPKSGYAYETAEESAFASRLLKVTDAYSGIDTEYSYGESGETAITINGESLGMSIAGGYAKSISSNKVTDLFTFDNDTIELITEKDPAVLINPRVLSSGTRKFAYDKFGRLLTVALFFAQNPIKYTFEYWTGKNGLTATELVKKVSKIWGGNVIETKEYYYDDNCNIVKVITNGIAADYKYDALGRLISDKSGGVQTVFYGKNGNISQKDGINYSYDQDWQDQLTGYGNKRFTYDINGNPERYMTASLTAAKNMTWIRGGLLATYNKDGSTIEFGYDVSGQRVTKTKGSKKSIYYSIGGIITGEDQYDGSTKYRSLRYLYGSSGAEGIKVIHGQNATTYNFEKDIEGIITGLYLNAEKIVSYKYDAWGKCTVLGSSGLSITDMEHIGHLNPFRYKGCYYDAETGLFLLGSRYYDPETGRFISPASIDSLIPNALGGLNLYAFPGNNPVAMYAKAGLKFPRSGFHAILERGGGSSKGSEAGGYGSGFKFNSLETRNSFGYEFKGGIDLIPYGWVGISVYNTTKEGGNSFVYAYFDNKIDFGNWTGWELPSVGVGINFWNAVILEAGVKAVGVEASISFGSLSFGVNANLLASVSLSIGWTTEKDGTFTTTEFSVGINAILLAITVMGAFAGGNVPVSVPVPGYGSISKIGNNILNFFKSLF